MLNCPHWIAFSLLLILPAGGRVCPACGTGPGQANQPDSRLQPAVITVAVAANLQFVINELKADFERSRPGRVRVSVVLGASGNLTTQIRQGAPFDLFISADTRYPASLYRDGLTADSPRVYCRGLLVLWTARTDLALSRDLHVLVRPEIRKIALANPRLAPYGEAAEQTLRKAGLFDQVRTKLVYGESIAQTSQFIYSRAADAGFTAKSVVIAGPWKDRGSWIEVDPASYAPIEQAAVLLRSNRTEASAFYHYLFSEPARMILRKYGYLVG
ncbi:MAG TPA: molybdate ABC transporter substrate-binding protein [Chitinophagaceae bacterium]|nr:molybdate ABC transporter substrate-binding protein [Chitinophagaceae bacterium]